MRIAVTLGRGIMCFVVDYREYSAANNLPEKRPVFILETWKRVEHLSGIPLGPKNVLRK